MYRIFIVCPCKLYALTRVTIASLHRHKPLNAHLPGDLLAFNGELDHLSLPNTSSNARHTFQLHCIEGGDAGVTWSNENWLQYPSGTSFMKL